VRFQGDPRQKLNAKAEMNAKVEMNAAARHRLQHPKILSREKCMSRKYFIATVGAASFLLWMGTVSAASPGSNLGQVCIRHENNEAVAILMPNSNLGSFSASSSPTVKLKHGDSVRVTVCDYNPLLFNYTLTTKTENIPDLDALKKLATALQTIVTNFAGKSGIQDMTVGGIDVDALRADIEKLNADVTDMTASADATVSGASDSAAFVANKAKVSTWPQDAKKVQTELAKLAELDAYPGTGKSISVSFNVPTAIVVPSSGNGVPDFSVASLDDLREKIQTTFNGNASDRVLQGQLLERLEYLEYALRHQQQFAASATLVSQFADVYGKVFSTEGPSILVAYSETVETDVSLSISANNTFAQVFSENTKDYQKKQITSKPLVVAFVPQQSWHLAVAPGGIYSFVQTQTYSTKQTGSIYTITSTQGKDYAALSGAVAINFIPDRFYYQGTQFYGQFGVVPSNGSMAFMLGVGANLYNEVGISVGAIYQQVTVLGSGLHVGQTLAAASDLVTEKTFKGGVYLGLFVNLGGSSTNSSSNTSTNTK
jgi:hypothetical protein